MHAANAATAEDHGVRTLERLDALDVVEVAEVLDVVADAIDEEVRCRAVAAQDRRVAIAFALREADARHVAGHVGHAGMRWSAMSSLVTTLTACGTSRSGVVVLVADETAGTE